jgi:3-methylcrotonyl-CoA carboxylase beta subunit
MGSCTAGGAYVPAMSDETIIVREPGHDLPRRPAAGESRHRRSGRCRGRWAVRRAYVHLGRGRSLAENDAHALSIARDIVASLNRQARPCRWRCARRRTA